MAINWLLKEILTCTHPRAQGAYISPTYGQSKRIAWQMLRDYAGVIPGVKFNEAELSQAVCWQDTDGTLS